jgi:hypothetical protein
MHGFRDLCEHQSREVAPLRVPRLLAFDRFGKDSELVACQPACDRAARQRARQPFAQRLEYAIAGFVAEGVVDLLEIIDVDVQQHQATARARAARDGLVQQVLELQSVRHLGERVESCQVADAAFCALAVGDVAQHEDVPVVAAVLPLERRHVDRHRDGLPPLCADHRLARLALEALEIEGRDVFARDQIAESHVRQLALGQAEEGTGGRVRGLNPAVRSGDQHRVADAIQHVIEVVARDRGGGQGLSHLFE